MRYGIQRRSVYLTPPSRADLAWIASAFRREEIYRTFGYDEPAGEAILARRAEVDIGVIRRLGAAAPLGFTLAFPPGGALGLPELAYAIPRRADRDAFTAISAADALSHYLFDHLNLEAVGWRTLASNLAAQAVSRRLGYAPTAEVRIGGARYLVHHLDRAGWRARRARIESAERLRPSGLGAAFVTLRGPPWHPLDPNARRLGAGQGRSP